MRHAVTARVYRGEKLYVGECLDLPVVTQGETLDATVANLHEAITLALEGEDLEALGLAPNLSLFVFVDAEPVSVA